MCSKCRDQAWKPDSWMSLVLALSQALARLVRASERARDRASQRGTKRQRKQTQVRGTRQEKDGDLETLRSSPDPSDCPGGLRSAPPSYASVSPSLPKEAMQTLWFGADTGASPLQAPRKEQEWRGWGGVHSVT